MRACCRASLNAAADELESSADSLIPDSASSDVALAYVNCTRIDTDWLRARAATPEPTPDDLAAHFRECDCHDSWDQCPCADGGHPKDGSCDCCPRGTGICGPRPEPVRDLAAKVADFIIEAQREIDDAKSAETYAGEIDNGAMLMAEESRRHAWEEIQRRLRALLSEEAQRCNNGRGKGWTAYPYREAARPEPDDDACSHDWTSRPESDTWVCEICGADR